VNFLRFIHCPTFLIFIHFKILFPISFSSIFKLSNPSLKTYYTSWQLRVVDHLKKMNKWWNHFHHIQSTIIPFKGSILKQCTIRIVSILYVKLKHVTHSRI
jgi:hypothetical protein